MKKKILFALIVLSWGLCVNAQTNLQANTVKAIDSLKLKEKWIKSILTDSALTGATSRDIASADALIKYIANRMAFTVKYGDTASVVSGYVRVQRFLDTTTAIQTRIQSKLTKADADTYYPAIQRLIDTATAIQARVQSKLTKADADTYYPAIQRLIDTATAIQARIQTKQPLLGYTAENAANKATDFSTVNNMLYPTVQAVSNYTQSALTGVLKDMGNYDASGNVFPSSGGSGSGGAIKKGDMWYISVAGTLGGKAVTAGAWIRALTDSPGQTAGNWAIADGGFGFTPANSARTLTINGTTYDLTANRTWSVGTVTSVGMSVPTGLSISGSPVTGSGTLAVSLQSGYSIPTTSSQTNWDAGYNDKINSITFSASTLTLTQQDGGTVTQSVPTFNQNTTGSAGSVNNSITFNNGGSGDASGISYNGGNTRTISYNTIGAPSTSGSGASGTWGINVTGTAASETLATVTGRGATTSTAINANGGLFSTGQLRSYGGDVRSTLDGSNSAASGAFFLLGNTAQNRFWLQQLNASNGISYFYYNGSSYSSSLQTLDNGGNWSVAGTGSFGGSVAIPAGQAYLTSGTSHSYISKSSIRLAESGDLSLLDIGIDNTNINITSNYYSGGAYKNIYMDARGGSNQLYLKNNGYVGINTSSPGESLSVQGVSNNWAANIIGYNSTGNSYGLLVTGGTNGSDYAFYVQNASGGSVLHTIKGNGNAVWNGTGTFNSTLTAPTIVTGTGSTQAVASTDGGGTYWEFSGSSSATQVLRFQGSNGSNYVQNFLDAGNQSIYWKIAGTQYLGITTSGISSTAGSFSSTVTATGFIGYTCTYFGSTGDYGTGLCGGSHVWLRIKADNGTYYYFDAYSCLSPI